MNNYLVSLLYFSVPSIYFKSSKKFIEKYQNNLTALISPTLFFIVSSLNLRRTFKGGGHNHYISFMI